ncbi:MAG TPA: MBL fold metallo-hydrolase [Polyangia bacterium]|nr:MBL fold metallo-hydrolase [Polyangia bacterium]
MNRLALALTLAACWAFAAPARAESKLSVEVVTASPQGFLVNSALVTGEKDAVLIDGQLTLADAHRLVGAILDSKKTLTTVYVTHWHPDHYFGLVVVKQAFPKVKIVAQPATVAEIKKTWQAKVKQWQPMFGDNLPAKPLIPAPLAGNTIALEGQTLEIHGPVQGDAANCSYVWIPSIKAVVTGDVVYQGVFPWTAETTAESRKAWLKTLDELTALNPAIVVAGHKDPKLKDDMSGIAATRSYLTDFDAAVASSRSAEELEAKMKAKDPKLQLDIVLHIGAGAAFPAAAPAPGPKK